VREGFIFFDFSGFERWSVREGRRGRPRVYSEGLIRFASGLRAVLRGGYRQLEGVLHAISRLVGVSLVPDYTTLWRRILRQGAELTFSTNERANTLILDSTGVTQVSRSGHLAQKWRAHRPYLKLHFAVDGEGRVHAALVTDQKGGDASTGLKLLKGLQAPERLLADGAYDSYEIFKHCRKHRIKPGIPVRQNARNKPLGAPLRTRTRQEQQENINEWKKRVHYKDRWTVESRFTGFKRRFGDATRARKHHQASTNTLLNAFITTQKKLKKTQAQSQIMQHTCARRKVFKT